jgi:hypothetical protein
VTAVTALLLACVSGCADQRWETDYRPAVERARQEDKPLFLYFGDFLAWEHHNLKFHVLEKPESKALLADTVKCELELRWHPEVARRYLVSSAPTCLLIDRAGNVCWRQVGPIELDAFLEELRQAKERAVRATPKKTSQPQRG